jgi:hypothetical protein
MKDSAVAPVRHPRKTPHRRYASQLIWASKGGRVDEGAQILSSAPSGRVRGFAARPTRGCGEALDAGQAGAVKSAATPGPKSCHDGAI